MLVFSDAIVVFSDNFYYPDHHGEEYYEQIDRGFGPQFEKSVDKLMNRVANQVFFTSQDNGIFLTQESRWSTV